RPDRFQRLVLRRRHRHGSRESSRGLHGLLKFRRGRATNASPGTENRNEKRSAGPPGGAAGRTFFMGNPDRSVHMDASTNLRWLRWLLTAIVVLLAVIAIELSALVGPLESRAMAQIPDSGQQRREILEALNRNNALLEGILQHLRSQTIKVKVVSTDKETRPEP